MQVPNHQEQRHCPLDCFRLYPVADNAFHPVWRDGVQSLVTGGTAKPPGPLATLP